MEEMRGGETPEQINNREQVCVCVCVWGQVRGAETNWKDTDEEGGCSLRPGQKHKG